MTSKPQNIVILTGAGISAESGIDTFRAKGGLWETYPVEMVATPEGFAANPALVHEFYNARRNALSVVSPNAAHFALAELEQRHSGSLLVVTQNVDNLHSQAGSQNVRHMHGDLLHMICTACDFNGDWSADCDPTIPCPKCGSLGTLRPDIVWFGEVPYHMDEIQSALMACDLFVSIGTSGAVYPAGGFVRLAAAHGAETLELNLEPSEGSAYFSETRLGEAGRIVPEWVAEILRA